MIFDKKKKTVLFLKSTLFSTFILLNLSSIAQIGYLGKRTLVKYELGVSPSFFNPTYNNDYGISKFHVGSVEYVTGHKTAVGVAYEYNKTGLSLDERVYFKINDNVERVKIKGKVNTQKYSLFINRYGKSPATLGVYSQFKISYISYDVIVNQEALRVDASNSWEFSVSEYPSRYENIKNDVRYSAFSLSYGLYKQRVLFWSIPINYGVQFSWLAGGFYNWDALNGYGLYDDFCFLCLREVNPVLSKNDYIKKGAMARLYGQGMISFKLGIGFLGF